MIGHWVFKTALVSLAAVILLLTGYAESCQRQNEISQRQNEIRCKSDELVGAVPGESHYTCNSKEYSHGSRCVYQCDKPGYIPCTNKKCYTCQSNGNWLPKPINLECCDVRRPSIDSCHSHITVTADPGSECAIVTWGVPSVTDNSGEAITARLMSEFQPGSMFCEGEREVRYRATDGAGNSNYCTFNVTVVVPKTPSCLPLEERPPASLTGCNDVMYEAPIGTTCFWQCPIGYFSVGNRVSRCTEAGSWDNDNFKCECSITCPILNPISPRLVSCSGYTVGSSCQWSCINGYRGTSTCSNTSTCLINEYGYGVWDRLNFECEETPVVLTCDSLPARSPAFHSFCNDPPDTDPVGTVCEWSCRANGFYGDGPNKSECLEDGTWSNTTFSCKALDCQMEPPRNGVFACSTTANRKYCFINCNIGFDIPRSVTGVQDFPHHNKNIIPYKCEDNKWENENYRVPDCSEIRRGNSFRLPIEAFYYSDDELDCTDMNNIERNQAIKNNFQTIILGSPYAEEYCDFQTNNCDVKDVKINCGPGATPTRKRRQVRNMNKKTIYRAFREANNSRDNAIPKLEAKNNLNKRNTRYEFTITFDLVMDFRPIEGHDLAEESGKAIDNINSMASKLYDMAKNGDMTPQCSGMNITPRLNHGDPINYWEKDAAPDCDSGYVESSKSCLCAPCFEGTFNNNSECQGCPIGTYQDQLAQTSCKACPSGKSTVGTGSSYVTDCRDICQPGEYSTTGLAPCTKCSIGFYQSDERATECIPCPDGSSTLRSGSQLCIVKCLPGSSSATGFYPCDECSFNYYQPESGQTECIPCLDNWITNVKGAVIESQCVEVQGGCASYPCLYNAQCLHYGSSAYYCLCEKGRDGQNCSHYSGARTDCGGTWIEPNGIFASPNYPSLYGSREQCAYFIKVPGAEQITFYFTDFDSEKSKDRLAYGSGTTVDTTFESSEYIEGNLTSDNMLPDPISVVGDNVWFFWKTDKNIEQRGFELNYDACLHQDLPPVKNGEFSCSNAACSVMCDKGFGIRHGKLTVYRCINGAWIPSNPAEIVCESAKIAIGVKQTSNATLDSSMNCNEIGYQEAFTEGVYTYLNSTIFGEACDDKCFFNDLKFECLQRSGAARRKRQAETPFEFLITMAITLNVDLNEAITMDEVNEDAEEMNFIMKKIVREMEDGTFLAYVASNIMIESDPIGGQPVKIGDVIPICEAGYSTAASTLTCIPCDVDTFESGGECYPCPGGQIQPYQGQTSCYPIPEE